MPRKYPAIAFTPSVKAAQADHGARALGQRLEASSGDDERLSMAEIAFLAERDGFYMATVNEDGWPYVQFRGGPKGFVKVLDLGTLGYADYRGNRQYVSTGNLRADDRVALFFMDYANRRRLKMFARAEVLPADGHADLAARLVDPGYGASVERLVRLHVAAFDWNCPQHITPRYTAEEIARARDRASAEEAGP